MIVCAVLYFIHISLGVFINVIFSVFICFICCIKFALFYGFVLGFCPKCVIVYDGGGCLGTGLCRLFLSWCAFSCCLVAHCVAPSAEMLPFLLLGSSCIFYVAAFSVFFFFLPLGRELCLRMTINHHTKCTFHGSANTLSCEHLLKWKKQMPLHLKSV
jgi:hypothetical protein